MARRAYAKRFAQAIFEIAAEKEELDRWRSDLRELASLTEDTAIIALFENPKVSFDDKAKLLSEQLGAINTLALNLVYLLISRGQLSILGEIADEYQRLLNSYRGIEEAEVVTATPIDDEDKQNLEERLSTIVGKKIVIKHRVDPGLIGGFIARVGGKLLDGSTRSRLEALKKELSGVAR